MILLLVTVAIATEFSCFTSTELADLKITPADRNGSVHDVIIGNWDSNVIMTKAASIIMKEAMGYEINEIGIGGSAESFVWLANSTSFAFAAEIWDYGFAEIKEYCYVARNVTLLGSPGYSGEETFFFTMPDPAVKAAFEYSPITIAEVQAYIGALNPATTAIAKVQSSEQFLRSNETARNIVAKAAGMEGKSIDEIVKPGHIFDPFNCYGTDNCFELMMPSTGWGKNVFQAIVKNLKMPAYITWWNDTNGYTRYWPLIKERTNAGLHSYFYWWQPDGKLASIGTVEEDYFPMLFKPHTKKCLADIRTDNIVGDGSRDCLDSSTGLLKMYTGKDIPEVYQDAFDFAIKYTLQLDDINNMLAGLDKVPATASDKTRQAACDWLKANPAQLKSYVVNTYEAPHHAEELSLELVAFTVFGITCVLMLAIYLVNYFDLVTIMEAKLLGSGMRVILGQMWDFLEIGSIVGAYLLEISGVPGISAWVQYSYLIVIVLNVCGCLYAGYLRYEILTRVFDLRESALTDRGRALSQFINDAAIVNGLKDVHDECMELYDFSTVEMYSLIMFELPQVILGFYMLSVYRLTETIFLVSLSISTLTMGMMLDVISTRLTYVKILMSTDQLFHDVGNNEQANE